MNDATIPGGYIILSRKLIESEIWNKPPLYLKVWIYLLSRAQHEDYKKLKRGQLWISIKDIQEACCWYVGFRKETPTKDQIYQIIDWLRKAYESNYESNEKAPMITTMKATRGMVINIEKYAFYQNPKNYESNKESNDEDDTKATGEQRAPNRINKNVKNVKNENTYTADFEAFYKQYPNPQDKLRSFNNWKRVLKEYSKDQIMNAVTNYSLKVKGTDKQYIKTSANFLGKEKFYIDYIVCEQEGVNEPSWVQQYREMGYSEEQIKTMIDEDTSKGGM